MNKAYVVLFYSNSMEEWRIPNTIDPCVFLTYEDADKALARKFSRGSAPVSQWGIFEVDVGELV
jgi:hypothetical protein